MTVSLEVAYSAVSGIAVLLSIINVLFLIFLHCSPDPALHIPFYYTFKVNVLYAVTYMLARTNFCYCFGSPRQIEIVNTLNAIGISGYHIGFLYIAVLRYSILRRSTLDEHSWSKWRLAALFAIQFAIGVATAVAFSDQEYFINGWGCYTFLQQELKFSIMRSILHACFLLPSLLLTTLTIKLSKAARRQQESLAKYTIYCAILKIVQCMMIFIHTLFIQMRISQVDQYTPLFLYIINLFYVNIPPFLLIYLSNQVRRRIVRLISGSVTTVQHVHLPTTMSQITMEKASNSRRRHSIFILIAISSLIGCVLFLAGKQFVFPKILAELYRLRQNEDGSLPLVTGYWANYPADTLHRFYLWNITNPDEVLYEGAIPRLLDHGPYVYVGSERKENLKWSRDGKEVSYRNRRIWKFDSSLSCDSCTENDRYIMPNVPYAGVSAISSSKDFSPLVATVFDLCTLITGSAPLQMVTSGGLLFNSYNHPIVALQNSGIVKILGKLNNGTVFGIKIPECPHAGLLACFNNTLEPEFRVRTGHGNIEDLTKIVTYGGKRTPDLYIGKTEIQNSNDGGFFKQNLQHDDKLHVFTSYLGRSFELRFHEEDTHDSVPTYIFRIDEDEYNSNAEKNDAMRYDNEQGINYFSTWRPCPLNRTHKSNETRCTNVECSKEHYKCDECCIRSHLENTRLTPPGFVPELIIPGEKLERNPVPVFLSPPHMLWAPKEVSSVYIGQHPIEEKHQPIEWAVNPTLGSVVAVNFRIQLNFVLARSKMTQSSSLPNSLAPTFWVHAEVRMHDDIIYLIKLGGLYTPLLLDWGPILFFVVAFISLTVISFDIITRRTQDLWPSLKENRKDVLELCAIHTV